MASSVVKFDTIDGQLAVTSTSVERIRTGTITGLQTSDVPYIWILEQAYLAITAVYPMGTGFPNNPAWILHSIRVWAMSGNSCKFEMVYSTVDWGTTVYLITDETYMEIVETEFLPGFAQKVPLIVSYNFPNIGSSGTTLIKDSVRFSLPMPVRSLTVTQISFGNPPTAVRPYVGYVNSDSTFLGLGPGFWRILHFKSQLSKFTSSYSVEAQIATRTSGDDWSQFGALQNRNTGQYADTTAVLPAALGLPYSYGIIYPSSSASTGGLVRIGPWQMISFNTLFPGLDPTAPPAFNTFGLG
jgi:hypothetical protein